MAIVGKRPRRINNDGKSITRLGIAKVALLPGSFAVLDASGEFIQATAPVKPLYIVNVDDKQGEDYLTPVVATESATCDFVEQGRQFAALVVGSTACILDTPLKLSATLGTLEKATLPEDVVVAYSMEIYTTPAGAASLVRVRVA